MKTKIISSLYLPILCLALLISIVPAFYRMKSNDKVGKRDVSTDNEVVYMSDIDGLVTAVMLYGITNGIVYNGTNYVFVVEPNSNQRSSRTSIDQIEEYNDIDLEPYTVIGEGKTNIEQNDFSCCNNLMSIIIADGITNIEDNAFECCSNLTSVKIPDGLTHIGSYAFAYCTNLTSITFPDSIENIGWWAFVSCDSLSTVFASNDKLDEIKALLKSSGLDISDIDFVEQ